MYLINIISYFTIKNIFKINKKNKIENQKLFVKSKPNLMFSLKACIMHEYRELLGEMRKWESIILRGEIKMCFSWLGE